MTDRDRLIKILQNRTKDPCHLHGLYEWADDIADHLLENGVIVPPWSLWFDKKYCQRCEVEKAAYVDSNRELEFAYCELHDNCRFFDCKMNNRKTIKMWFDLDCEEN